jgi:metallo-beta-lactamase class B
MIWRMCLAACLALRVYAAVVPSWREPSEPARIVGPIYFVGTKGLGVFLIATKEGHILLDGAMPGSEGLIEESIRKLGFKIEDVKQLLISQAHFDHVGTLAHFKKTTGAKLAVMEGDDVLLKSGGKADYLFGATAPYHFEAVTPDRVLKDGDVVELGGVKLTARHTPGHTRGCTTWVMKVQEDEKVYEVVFAGSTTVNPGTRLGAKPSYDGIVEDYRRSFAFLESLKPDIFLGAHTDFFAFEAKRKRAATEGPKAYVDLEGYRR